MKQRTIDRISTNYACGRLTKIGRYSYNLRYNPWDSKWWIVRCPYGREKDEFIRWDGLQSSYWNWMEPVTFNA